VVIFDGMSKKPGRNDPCSCGSGKKYKRCCLPKDEAASREAARQQGLFEDDEAFDEFDLDEDDDAEAFSGVEQDALNLDVRAITRVSYTRGLIKKLSDLRTGRGVRVTEWEAPHIPQAVLDSIEREEIDAVEGEWGDPKAGVPIQVEVIDLETAEDVFSIEVFNRGVFLFHEDSDEMRRIHRVCEVLEAAAPDRSERPPEPGAAAAVAVIRRAAASPTAVTGSNLSDVLKEHRKQPGTCALCGETVSRANAHKHAGSCAPAHDLPRGTPLALVQLRATAPGLPAYWLDVEAKADATLEALDSFLRRVWLDCCGHLSAFKIGTVEYFSRGYEFGFGREFGGFGGQRPVQRSMNARLRDSLPFVGELFDYEYDFGSTTSLQLKMVGERAGQPGRARVRLLARNTSPVWPCAICRQPATLVCTYCLSEDRNAFVCTKHRRKHACGEDEGFMPVVNSPRMGVCGYTAET
jgi:hypothetical protein